MNLHEYGIAEEKSDIRAHVCLPGHMVTVYKTRDMVALLATRRYPIANGYQANIDFPTSKGFLVPLDDIQPQHLLRSSRFPWGRWRHSEMGCKEKGDMAVLCVRAAIQANLFPLWLCGVVCADREIDIQGTDIVVSANRRIQVKYDCGAHPKKNGGTGNLFIQTHECNPLGIC